MKKITIIVLAQILQAGCIAAKPVAAHPQPRTGYDTTCSHDSDCAPAPSCCPAPCTYNVINVRELPRAQAALRCRVQQDCPSAGSCIDHRYRCVSGNCKIVFHGEPEFLRP